MTTEIEKQFFDTFGIEPKLEEYDVILCTNPETKPIRERRWHKFYPQITEHILLNLVLIMNPYGHPIGSNLEEFKQHILELSIGKALYIKPQVQALFEEG